MLKKLKYTREVKNFAPRLKWLMFSSAQSSKTSQLLDEICDDRDKTVLKSNDSIENMVKEMLVREFSADIENMKSYGFLVDAVVHNLKKGQNQRTE